MVLTRQSKTQFTEIEAAEELGLSIEQLRSLIRYLIAETDGDPAEATDYQLQPADLLLLKMVSSSGTQLEPENQSIH